MTFVISSRDIFLLFFSGCASNHFWRRSFPCRLNSSTNWIWNKHTVFILRNIISLFPYTQKNIYSKLIDVMLNLCYLPWLNITRSQKIIPGETIYITWETATFILMTIKIMTRVRSFEQCGRHQTTWKRFSFCLSNKLSISTFFSD